jgi:hypothetical protein
MPENKNAENTEPGIKPENKRRDRPDLWLPTLVIGLLMLSSVTTSMIILFFFHTK